MLTRFLCWLRGHKWSPWECETQNIPGLVEGGDINCKRHCERAGCDASQKD